MRKLNGITINGEYLGNSVVINGMFRAICTISPSIMRDFVQIINKIEKLEEAVKIHNFNCGFDSIDIEFENTNSKGIASLYFKLKNGEPELINCKLVIDDQEYSTLQDTIKLPAKMTSPDTSVRTEEQLERLKKIRELKEKKLEKIKQQKQQNNAMRSPMTNAMQHKPPLDKPMEELSPEERLKRKRQELLEKKRQALAAAKAKRNGQTAPDSAATTEAESFNSISDDSENEAITENSSVNKDKNNGKSEKTENLSGDLKSETGTSSATSGGESFNSANNTDDSTEMQAGQYDKAGSVSDSMADDNGVMSSDNYDESYSSDGVSSSQNNDDVNYDDLSDEELLSMNLEDLSDEEIANLSDEELAQLEAELDAELGNEYSETGYSDYNDSYSSNSYQGPSFGSDFAERLSQGLTEGLTQGLSQGLSQGLQGIFQGLSQSGFGMGGGQSFGNGMSGGYGGGFDFSESGSSTQSMSPQIVQPDYNGIDNRNFDASLSARDSYSYDENSNLDDLSDLYSDFYDENRVEDEEETAEAASTDAQKNPDGPNTSEVDALKAELEALKAEAESKKDLMTLDDFLAKQKDLADAQEKKRRQKLRIVGSREHVNASALEGGVFVAGNKVYKWGDTRVLDE